MDNFRYNQDRAIILAPLRFSRQDGSNDISIDPVISTSKFALKTYMGSSDPRDTVDLSYILNLEHQKYPRNKLL